MRSGCSVCESVRRCFDEMTEGRQSRMTAPSRSSGTSKQLPSRKCQVTRALRPPRLTLLPTARQSEQPSGITVHQFIYARMLIWRLECRVANIAVPERLSLNCSSSIPRDLGDSSKSSVYTAEREPGATSRDSSFGYVPSAVYSTQVSSRDAVLTALVLSSLSACFPPNQTLNLDISRSSLNF
jgi:hypothetical protein